MPWFLPMLAAAAGATVATKIQNKRDKKAYSAAETKNEERRGDYYVNLRNDAEKGGFNPLTALRSGGGMGYSNLAGRITQPLMTRSPLAAGIAAGSNAYANYSMTRMNQQHDEKMARLKSDLYRADALAIHKGTQPADPYEGYTDKIPVKFGFKDFMVPVEIAKRLRIEPNDRVSAGEIAELMGEAAEVVLAFASAGMEEQYETMQLGLLGGDEPPTGPQVTRLNDKPMSDWEKGIREAIDKATQPSITRLNKAANVFSGSGGYMNNPHYSGIFY